MSARRPVPLQRLSLGTTLDEPRHERARQPGGGVAADGDYGHDLDVVLTEDRRDLHRRISRRAQRLGTLADLTRRVLPSTGDTRPAVSDVSLIRAKIRDGRMNLRQEVEALERSALAAALGEARGNAARAAQLLGTVGRGTARDPGGTVRAMKRRLRYRG